MDNTTPTEEPSNAVAGPRDKPDAQQINEMVRGAVNAAEGAGKFEDLALCYSTRRMLWENQEKDGRMPELHQLPEDRHVYTWPGAPDVRVPYADELVEEHQLLRSAVVWEGEIKLAPRETDDTDGQMDEEKATGWQAALELFLDVMQESFTHQQGLFHVCIEEYGYSGVLVGCRKRIRADRRTIKKQQVYEAIVQQQQQQVMEEMMPGADTLQGPELMASMIQERAQAMLALVFSEDGQKELQALLQQMDAAMTASEARIAARELQESGQGVYYAPQDDGYWPYTQALIPFINWIHGPDLKGDGSTWWHAFPEVLSEADLRARAAAENWNDDFLTRVLEKKNELLIDGQNWKGQIPRWALSGTGVMQDVAPLSETDNFYQVIYVYRHMPDKNGRTMVYQNLVHASVNDVMGIHEATGMECLPVHVACRERVLYAMESRGLPQIVVAGQNQIKDQMDAEGARAQLGSNPPLERSVKEHTPIRPGKQLLRKRDEGNQFLVVPQADQGALLLIDKVREMLDRRFFRHKESDPDIKRLYRKGIAYAAAMSVRCVVRLMWKVMQGKIDSLRASRIAGRPVTLDLERDDMQGDVDVTVDWSVDSLNAEAADKFMGWVLKLSQADRGGIVDWAEVLNIAARMSNANMARRILISSDKAADKMRMDQRNRIAQLWSGATNLDYPDRQAGVEARLEEMQAWLQNPENQGRLQSAPKFAEAMQAEQEYLQNQWVQYQANPARGRAVMPKAAGAPA